MTGLKYKPMFKLYLTKISDDPNATGDWILTNPRKELTALLIGSYNLYDYETFTFTLSYTIHSILDETYNNFSNKFISFTPTSYISSGVYTHIRPDDLPDGVFGLVAEVIDTDHNRTVSDIFPIKFRNSN